jgi:hypothetical protein
VVVEVFRQSSRGDFVAEDIAVKGFGEHKVLEEVRRFGVDGGEEDVMEGVEGFQDELRWEGASVWMS